MSEDLFDNQLIFQNTVDQCFHFEDQVSAHLKVYLIDLQFFFARMKQRKRIEFNKKRLFFSRFAKQPKINWKKFNDGFKDSNGFFSVSGIL